MATPELSVFEIVLAGFDGSTDCTDHLIKWVVAERHHHVYLYATREGMEYLSILPIPVPTYAAGIDCIVDSKGKKVSVKNKETTNNG